MRRHGLEMRPVPVREGPSGNPGKWILRDELDHAAEKLCRAGTAYRECTWPSTGVPPPGGYTRRASASAAPTNRASAGGRKYRDTLDPVPDASYRGDGTRLRALALRGAGFSLWGLVASKVDVA